MCASATMVSLKFPLQDPPQQAASSNTTMISIELNCFTKQTGLFVIQHNRETFSQKQQIAGAPTTTFIPSH